MPFGTIKLNDGNEIPVIAYGSGTALYGHKEEVVTYVKQAIKSGFTHIDTAQIYSNEDYVGVALKESGVPRKDLYITTKYSGGVIQDEIKTSLSKLGLDQVDLYLIHHPKLVDPDFETGWRAMESFQNQGLTKSIGFSNFNAAQTRKVLEIAKVKPAVNQIRLHPYNYAENKELLELSKEHGIVIEAFSVLASLTHRLPGGPLDPVVDAIAARNKITPAQVLLLWAMSKEVVIVTTSTKEERLTEYLAVGDLPPLSAEDILAIDETGAKGHPNLPT